MNERVEYKCQSRLEGPPWRAVCTYNGLACHGVYGVWDRHHHGR